MGKRKVPVNAKGRVVGEDNPRATIPDWVVYKLRNLHEHKKIRYNALVELFREEHGMELKLPTVIKICNYLRRAERIDREIEVEDDEG